MQQVDIDYYNAMTGPELDVPLYEFSSLDPTEEDLMVYMAQEVSAELQQALVDYRNLAETHQEKRLSFSFESNFEALADVFSVATDPEPYNASAASLLEVVKRNIHRLQVRRLAQNKRFAFRPIFRKQNTVRFTRTRAPRSARRASFSVAASSPGGGDSSGDPDSGDPPGPYPFRSFVTPPSNRKHNQEPSRPWLGLGCCLMERGRSA